MQVWIAHRADTVHSDGPSVRLFRYGLLADALLAQGHEVLRWAPTFDHATRTYRATTDAVIDVAARHRIRLIHARGYTANIGYRRALFHNQVARRWILQQQDLPSPDIIITGMPTPDMCAAARRISRRRNVPLVLDVRDVWPDALFPLVPPRARPPLRAATLPVVALNRRNFRAAAAVTAVSPSYLQWGLRMARRSRGSWDRVFPLGYAPPKVDTEKLREASRRWRDRLGNGGFVALFLGSMGKSADIHTVIEAARILGVRNPGRFQWVIAGDGPERLRAEEAARGMGNVTFPGWVGTEDIAALLGCADVGLAPYVVGVTQSLPNKPFEYAWAGLPVVSSLRGEFAELLNSERFGTTYAAGSAWDLAQAVARYAADRDLLAEHGAHGRSVWRSMFSAETVYGEMAEHLSRLAVSFHGTPEPVKLGETRDVGHY